MLQIITYLNPPAARPNRRALYFVMSFFLLFAVLLIPPTSPAQERTPAWAPFILPWDDSPVDISFVFEDEKPAGKHGFLTAKGGRFVFEDGTPARFWGTCFNSGSIFPTHGESEMVAKRLAKFGVNLVRPHQMDGEWATPNIFQANRAKPKDNTRSLDPESLDRFDYLVHCLKEQGIYVYLDLLTYRRFKQGDGVDAFEGLGDAAKPYSTFDPRLIELQEEFAQQLLTHVNPYTGLAYKDEPAIVLTEITNENDLFTQKAVLEPYRSRLAEKFRQWARQKGIAVTDADIDFSTPSPVMAEFFVDVTQEYYTRVIRFMNGLGLRIPVAGTNWSRNLGLLEAQLVGGFTDSHAYWNFPLWAGVRGETDTTPMVASRSNTFASLTLMRTLDRPFSVSEWDQPWPSEWRAESPLAYAAVASFQDWGSVAIHTYRYSSWEPVNVLGGGASTINSVVYRKFFDAFNDPAKFGLFPHAALIFRRGDVRPAEKSVAIQIPGDDPAWRLSGTGEVPALSALCELHRAGIAVPGEPAEADMVIPPVRQLVGEESGEVLSDTNELWRSWEKRYARINTPRTKAAYGFLGRAGEISLGGVALSVKTDFAAVALSSLTDDPVERSQSMLLTAVGRCGNTDEQFNGAHSRMLDFGGPPTLIEVIDADISIKTAVPQLKVWLISEKGDASVRVPVEYENGTLKFHIGPQPWHNPSSIYYLITQ